MGWELAEPFSAQPAAEDPLAITRTTEGVDVTVRELGTHAMVVFESAGN